MNGEAAAGFAKALAQRIANDSGQSPNELVERAFRLTLGRAPSKVETERSRGFLAMQTKLTGSQAAALEDLALSLLSSSEFIYID